MSLTKANARTGTSARARFRGGCLSLALLGAAAVPASADEAWRFTLTPYLWLQGTTGDITVKGFEAHVDDSFLDMLDSSDTLLGGFVHLEGAKGPFGFWLEGNYSYTSTEDELKGGISTQVQTGLAILEAGGFYTFAAGELGPGQPWKLNALAGVRYVNFHAELEVGPLEPEATMEWVDPLIGLGAQLDLGPQWTLVGHGDIGGFGVGSEFSANLYGLVGYRTQLFGADAVGGFGYRGLYIDREEGSNGADLWLHGPILSLTIRF